MKRYILNIAFLLLLVGLFSSCYKDKGNYDYKEFDKPVLSIDGKTEDIRYNVDPGYVLNITPKITYSGSESDLNYEWYLMDSLPVRDELTGFFPKPKQLGNNKTLNYVVNDSPGKYFLHLKVVDKSLDNMEFFIKISMVVMTKAVGMMVLDIDEATSEGDIHVVRNPFIIPGLDQSQSGVIPNVFSGVNGFKIPDPVLIAYEDYKSAAHQKIFVFTKNNGVALFVNTMKMKSAFDYRNLFAGFPPETFGGIAHSEGLNGREYINSEGSLFVADFMTMGSPGKFGAKMLPIFAGDKAINAIPYFHTFVTTTAQYGCIAFDKNNGRFLPFDRFGKLSASIDGSGPFSLNNVPKDARYLEAGNLDHTFLIVQNNGKPWLYEANFATATINEVTAVAMYDLSSLTDIVSAKHYAFGNRGNICFYGTDTKIYRYNYSDNSNALVFTAPAGETITCMSIYKNNSNEVYNSKLLFVGTYNSSSKEGKVHCAEFNELNGTLIGTPLVYTGFKKVICFEVKP